jgi:hypothetical protein
MVLNATFNNISVISWMLVLLVMKTGVLGENHRHVKSLTNFFTYCCIECTSPWTGLELTTLVVIGTDCTVVVNTTTIRSRPRRPLVDLGWLIYCVQCHFQQYFSYIMATSFSGGRGQSTRREPPTGQATGKLYHLRLQVECTLFVIYKAGREPTPYWW